METLEIYQLGFSQNYCTIAVILLIKNVLCSNFHFTKFINCKCFPMRSAAGTSRLQRGGSAASWDCSALRGGATQRRSLGVHTQRRSMGVYLHRRNSQWRRYSQHTERICIELMTSDRKLKASREGSKKRIYGTQK